MLDMKSSIASTDAVRDAIWILTGDRSERYVEARATITATVNNRQVITGEAFNISLSFDGTNYAAINIFWEESGFKNYKDLGLYGTMSTQYQRVASSGARSFIVKNGNYSVEVEY